MFAFALPFLASPLNYGLQAYKSTRVDLAGNKGMDKESFDEKVKANPGHKIKTQMQPFFDQMGIRKDLIVVEQPNPGFCMAVGTNSFTKGNAVIVVMPGFQEVDKDACHWVIKHETAHIKNNDLFTMSLVPAISSLAAAILSTVGAAVCFSIIAMPIGAAILIPVGAALLVTGIVGFVAQAIFSQYREGKADDLAIAESTDEELKGGRRFLMSLNAINLRSRKTIWDKIIISSNGENRLDFLHPSTASRIRKIELALQQRNIKIDDPYYRYFESSGQSGLDLQDPSTKFKIERIERALQQQNIAIDHPYYQYSEARKIVTLTELMYKTNLEIKEKLEKIGMFRLMMAQFL